MDSSREPFTCPRPTGSSSRSTLRRAGVRSKRRRPSPGEKPSSATPLRRRSPLKCGAPRSSETVASAEMPPLTPRSAPGMSRAVALSRSSTRTLAATSIWGSQRSRTLPLTKSESSVPIRSARRRSTLPVPRRSTMPATREEIRPTVRPGSSSEPPRVETLTASCAPRLFTARPARGMETRPFAVRTSRLALRTLTRPNSNRSSTSGRHCPPEGGPAPPWSSASRSSGWSISSRSRRTFCSSGRTFTCANTREIRRSILPPGSPTRSPSIVSFPCSGSTEQRETCTVAAVASSIVATA